jgi:hypothetical protein
MTVRVPKQPGGPVKFEEAKPHQYLSHGDVWHPIEVVDVKGDKMRGNLEIEKPSPMVILDGTQGGSASIRGQNAGQTRWEIVVGNSAPENGNNTGSDFGIYAYQDNGVNNYQALFITRSDMRCYVIGAPINPNGVANKGYVDSVAATSTARIEELERRIVDLEARLAREA